MKKGLIFLIGIISFFGVNTVSAEEIYLESTTNINKIKPYIDEIGYDKINTAITENIKYYNENLASNYPYYFISLSIKNKFTDNEEFHVVLTSLDSIESDNTYNYFSQAGDSYYRLVGPYSNFKQIRYDFNFNQVYENDVNFGFSDLALFTLSNTYKYYDVYNYYYSNFNLYYKGTLFTEEFDNGYGGLTYLNPNDTLYIPTLKNSSSFFKHQANTDFLIEPYYLYDNNDSFVAETYTEINLNEHAYVALSLKDYNTIPESNFSTYTNIYVKGQACITPVYNYGLTERKDILTGTQVEGCGLYYPDFTLDKMYILRDDVKNHAIYYIKPYDTSKENVIKIDSSKFNITYISEANASNPQVDVNGKVYPTIPYDELTDTSTKSEDEGYVPGVSCSFGDIKCLNENNLGNIFTELIENPLNALSAVWNAITTIFALITSFLLLLPPVMQGFLYITFILAIVLGIIKIIL